VTPAASFQLRGKELSILGDEDCQFSEECSRDLSTGFVGQAIPLDRHWSAPVLGPSWRNARIKLRWELSASRMVKKEYLFDAGNSPDQ
jgi:hypothetical protein